MKFSEFSPNSIRLSTTSPIGLISLHLTSVPAVLRNANVYSVFSYATKSKIDGIAACKPA